MTHFAATRRRRDSAEKERDFIIALTADVADRLDLHIKIIEKVVDDVLWCENHDTHAIYSATWLMEPAVYDEPFTRLRDVCKLYLDDETEDPND